MCTIHCSSEEFKVILDSLHSFKLESEDRLVGIDPDDSDSFYERLWRNRYELCEGLLSRLDTDLPF